MTVKEKNYLAKEAAEKIFRGTDVSEVQDYVFKQVGKHSYDYMDVWDNVMWLLEYAPEME